MEPTPHKLPVRFYEIDLLRFLAALSVVFYHYTYRGAARDNLSPVQFWRLGQVSRYGLLGVELFFLISGYVILLSAQGKTVRQFLISRVTRLYPAFWVACTLTFAAERIWGPAGAGERLPIQLHATLEQYPYNMTMLVEFFGKIMLDGSYWSLTVEITFYFLVSLLIAYRLMRHVDWFLAGWLLYVAIAGAVPEVTPFSQLFFPRYAPYFAAGMLFYLLQQPQGRTWRRYGLLLAAYVLALQAGVTQAREMSGFYQDTIARSVELAIITIFFGLFFLIAFRKINLSRFSWLSWLGALTYPLYLVHQHIGYLLFHYLGPYVNKYVLLGGVVAAMLGIAYLIHVLAEKPLSKPLGAQLNKWLARLDHQPAQPQTQPAPALRGSPALEPQP